MYEALGNQRSIAFEPFPEFNASYLVEQEKEYPISFNGKLRFKMNLPVDFDKKQIEEAVLQDDRTTHYLGGNAIKKIIVVPGKIVNIVQ